MPSDHLTLSFLLIQCGPHHHQECSLLLVSLPGDLLSLLLPILITFPPCAPLCPLASHLLPWVLSLLSSPSPLHHTTSRLRSTHPCLKTPSEPDKIFLSCEIFEVDGLLGSFLFYILVFLLHLLINQEDVFNEEWGNLQPSWLPLPSIHMLSSLLLLPCILPFFLSLSLALLHHHSATFPVNSVLLLWSHSDSG